MEISNNLLDWLLEGDPSIRWQVYQDLLNSKKSVVENERALTEKEGWCKKLLSYQDKNGIFGGGLYSPKWISTTYTMLLLSDLGLIPTNEQAAKSCKVFLEKGFFKDNGINFFDSWKYSETCVTGIVFKILSYFRYKDDRIKKIAGHLISQQMKDGGWNCRSYRGATHSSFHTTINVLEGLGEFEKSYHGNSEMIKKVQKKGVEFLLQHKLFKSHKSGIVVDNKMTMFSFPTRWRYDILRCLDYFQKNKVAKDERMKDAIEILLKRMGKDGKWNLQNKHPGKVYFDLEPAGKPSRINTLRALRVLKWWES